MAEFNNKLIILGFLLVIVLLLTVGLKYQSATGAAVAGQNYLNSDLSPGFNSDVVFDEGPSTGGFSAGTNWMAIETAMDANIAEYAVDMERCRGIPLCESIAKRELDQRTEQINGYFTLSLISGEPVDIERALSTEYVGFDEEEDADGVGDAEEVVCNPSTTTDETTLTFSELQETCFYISPAGTEIPSYCGSYFSSMEAKCKESCKNPCKPHFKKGTCTLLSANLGDKECKVMIGASSSCNCK